MRKCGSQKRKRSETVAFNGNTNSSGGGDGHSLDSSESSTRHQRLIANGLNALDRFKPEVHMQLLSYGHWKPTNPDQEKEKERRNISGMFTCTQSHLNHDCNGSRLLEIHYPPKPLQNA